MKFNSLQILRGIAAILVVLYHTSKHYTRVNLDFLGSSFDLGYSGVDIFFVLSGFVIYHTSKIKINTGKYVNIFILQRLARIYPSYWVFSFIPLTIIFFISPILLPNREPFYSNEWIYTFFLLFGHLEITQITWTLSYELFFYFLFSLIVFNKRFIYLVAPIFILSIVNLLNYLPDFTNHFFERYIFNPLLLEFLLGCFAAILITKIKVSIKFKIISYASLIGGIILFLMFSQDIFTSKVIIREYRTLFYGVPAFLIVIGLAMLEINKKINVINTNFWIKVGDASYILYLIHSPIVSAGNSILLKSNINHIQFLSLLLVVILIITSVILHVYIENPIYIYLKNKIHKLNRLN